MFQDTGKVSNRLIYWLLLDKQNMKKKTTFASYYLTLHNTYKRM